MVSYNSRQFLDAFMSSLKKNTRLPYHLIIIDNHSNDSSRSYLTHFKRSDPIGQQMTLIFNSRNIGISKAWNQGMSLCNGKYIIFLNPDIIFTEGWLEKMINCAERHPNTGVIGAKILDYSGQRISHAGFINSQLLGHGEPNLPGKYDTEMEVDGIHGCCFLVRRNIIPVVGKFDERFFIYAEEDDFCIRVKQAGYSILYCPVPICHFSEGSTVSPSLRMSQHLESVAKLKSKWGFQ